MDVDVYVPSTTRHRLSSSNPAACECGASAWSPWPKKYARIWACRSAFMKASERSTHPPDLSRRTTCTASWVSGEEGRDVYLRARSE